MLLSALLVSCLPQAPAASPTPLPQGAVCVALTPREPGDADRLAWSPKGAKVDLTRNGDRLTGSLALGPTDAPRIAVQLERSPGAERFDVLSIDADRDGSFGASERLTTTPRDQRGKWWSSFTTTVDVVFPKTAATPERRVPYPMSLWFVEDPAEPDAPPALRWSRRGWHEGRLELGGREVFVLVADMDHDGVFSTADHWALAQDRKALLGASSRAMSLHAWLGGRAFRVGHVAADGSSITFAPFDPGTTQAEEKERADVHKQDREAPRAASPLAFGKDFDAALAAAKRTGNRVLVDFSTEWCGPCKLMDQHVFTAADVVAAAAGVVAVKLDGDRERDLVKRFAVSAYPTLLLLDADGAEVRRAVGYQGVAAMVRFLGK
jgi:thiol-disulfide isomerase/thioredoxin